MTNAQKDVEQFMILANQDVPPLPNIPTMEVRKLRYTLINEELSEFREALGLDHPDGTANLTDTYDAILDLLYVVIGSAVAFGLDVQPGWDEVHKSNLAKFQGGYRRSDGKWIKPADWKAPDLEAVIQRMIESRKSRATDCP